MTSSAAPVLVAGGGPSGLVAALTLLQNSVPVRIIDKEPKYRISQRGNAVWPRTFEVFHFLRALDVYQSGRPILPVQEYKPGTLEPVKSFLMITLSDPTPSIPYSNPVHIGQPTLEGVLRSHIEKFGCFVELGTELVSLEDDGQRVLAKLVKRKDGEEVSEIFEASYIIGADGAKGVTRKQLGLTFLGETRQDSACVVGDLRLEIDGLDRNHWHFFGDRTADFFSLRPTDEIAPDGYQFLITLKDYDPKELIADETLMFKRMSEIVGQEINVKKVVILSEFRPNIRMVDKFGRGRVFVAGDAAHVHSPAGGQGLNSGVQDSFNLAWKLSLVYKGLSPAKLLDSYTAERLPVIAEMLEVTTGMHDKMINEASIDSAMERGKRLNMLGVNYRTSQIVFDEFMGSRPVNAYRILDETELIAGDRAPDAPELALVSNGVVTETRLFDLFSATYHTVLIFTNDASSTLSTLETLRKYPPGTIRTIAILPQGSDPLEEPAIEQLEVAVDRGGHANRAYLVVKMEPRVVVVRPDGVVGATVRPGAGGLIVYFSNIFHY